MSSISPKVLAVAIHFSFFELSFIVWSILKFHEPFAFYLIVSLFFEELSLIGDSIAKIDGYFNSFGDEVILLSEGLYFLFLFFSIVDECDISLVLSQFKIHFLIEFWQSIGPLTFDYNVFVL